MVRKNERFFEPVVAPVSEFKTGCEPVRNTGSGKQSSIYTEKLSYPNLEEAAGLWLVVQI